MIFGLHYAYGYVWLDKPFVIKSKKEFDRLQKEHRVTDEQFKRWGWEFPVYAYRIKKKELFKNPSPIKLPRGVQNILINPERYMDVSFEKSNIRAKVQKLTPEEYKQLIKEGDYKNKPLPSKYYVDYREGYAFAQCFGEAQTPIYTRSGWKRFKDLAVGDEVLTHKGRFRKIIKKERFKYLGKWFKVTVKFGGMRHHLRVTNGHQFLTPDGWKEVSRIKRGDIILSLSDSECKTCGSPIPIKRGWEEGGWNFCSRSCAVRQQHKNQGSMFGDARKKLDMIMKTKLQKGEWGFQDREKAKKASAIANRKLAKQRISYPHQKFIDLIDAYDIDYAVEYPLHTCGHTFYADVAIPELRIDFEIDGRRHHDESRDAMRDFLVSVIGWKTIRIDADKLNYKSKKFNIDEVRKIISNTIKNDTHQFRYAKCVVDRIEIVQYSEEQLKRCPRLKWAYNIEVEEDHSYLTPCMISHNCHIRGIKPEDRDAYLKHKKSFKDIIIGHSLHCDIRWHLRGIDKLIQGILVESDIESYIRVLLGELNKEQKGPANVQKGLFLSKERMQIEEPSNMRIKKTKEYLIDEKGAEIIDKYIMKDKSLWLYPGDVGATIHAFGYLGAIWTGKVKTGVARPDYHELFFYSDTDQPELNQKFLNGRFIIKAFKRPQGSPLYWMWKATADPEPENPYCHLDMGYHPIMLETKIKYFKKEDYPEWDKRKEICT